MPWLFRSSARRRPHWSTGCWITGLALALSLAAGAATAASSHDRSASLLLDANSGEILESTNADATRYPASLTKMMTLYLTFEALDHGLLSLDQRLPVSAFAAAQPPTKVGLPAGFSISVENAILALVTKSANDMSVVLAEAIGGSEYGFAEMMTAKARQLGMVSTVFRNASGLPDPYQVTTARDMATLARALLHDYPQYYPYFSTRYFSYGGRMHANHNHLLNVYEGMDGIKTGYTRASGYNLVASAQRDGRRLIGVVLGARSSGSRGVMMTSLLDAGFHGDHGVAYASNRHVGESSVPPSAPEVVGRAPVPAWTTAYAPPVAYAAPLPAPVPVTTYAARRTPVVARVDRDEREVVASRRGERRVAASKPMPQRWAIAGGRREPVASARAERGGSRGAKAATLARAETTARGGRTAQPVRVATREAPRGNARAVAQGARKPIVVAQVMPPARMASPLARPIASGKATIGADVLRVAQRGEPAKSATRVSCYKIGNRPVGC